MQIVRQKIEDILGSLRHLEVDWRDETAIQVIAKLQGLPVKAAYSIDDVEAISRPGSYMPALKKSLELRHLAREHGSPHCVRAWSSTPDGRNESQY